MLNYAEKALKVLTFLGGAIGVLAIVFFFYQGVTSHYGPSVPMVLLVFLLQLVSLGLFCFLTYARAEIMRLARNVTSDVGGIQSTVDRLEQQVSGGDAREQMRDLSDAE